MHLAVHRADQRQQRLQRPRRGERHPVAGERLAQGPQRGHGREQVAQAEPAQSQEL
ncbi:hypothetical protein [Nonomuraea wenchangensis]